GSVDGFSLDGGGSSTLVARTPGAPGVSVRNRPAGGAERPVPNGSGGFSSGSRPANVRRHGVPASRRIGVTTSRTHVASRTHAVTDPRTHAPTASRTHGLTASRPHGLRLPTMSAVAVRPLWIVGAMFVPAR